MSTRILTAESVSDLPDVELFELWQGAVLHGDEDSDFALAAQSELINERGYDKADLEDELNRAINERRYQKRLAEEEAAGGDLAAFRFARNWGRP